MTQILFSLLLDELLKGYKAMFGCSALAYWQAFAEQAMKILALIDTTDAPYHNGAHTVQVLQVGQAILASRQQQHHDLTPQDWLQMMVALLCHDVGYLRGACRADDWANHRFAVGCGDAWVELPMDATDASLAPYHVDRGQQYVQDRFADHPLIDPAVVAAYIEWTRFPAQPQGADPRGLGALCRAADLLGQLSDVDYLAKLPALFCEFEEIGLHGVLGYDSALAMRSSYPQFYWQTVAPQVQGALRLLATTAAGRLVIARLFTNVYLVELEQSMMETTSPALRRRAEAGQLQPYPIEADNAAESKDFPG